MLQLFPRAIPSDKESALVISGDDLKGKRKVKVAVQSMNFTIFRIATNILSTKIRGTLSAT